MPFITKNKHMKHKNSHVESPAKKAEAKNSHLASWAKKAEAFFYDFGWMCDKKVFHVFNSCHNIW